MVPISFNSPAAATQNKAFKEGRNTLSLYARNLGGSGRVLQPAVAAIKNRRQNRLSDDKERWQRNACDGRHKYRGTS